jgi:hypothetical protein
MIRAPMTPERAPSARPFLLLALLVATGFVALMLSATRGHFVPQVVDLYVVCQYARAMAEGHPFQYNPGEAASTGATSLLHTSLLAVAHAVGARGEGLVAFAVAAGALLFLGSVALARRIGALLGGGESGSLAAALVALGGPVVWGFLYGSDIALFMFLSLWLLDRLLAEWSAPPSAPRGIALSGSLLALARPEGLPLTALVGAAFCFWPGRASRGPSRYWSLAPVAAGLAWLGLNRVLVGQWLGSSVADKSLVANYGLGPTLALVSEYVVDATRGLLLGFYPSQTPVGFSRGWAPFYFPPLGLVFVLVALARAPAPLRVPARLFALAAAGVVGLLTPNVFLGVHFNRYLLWAVPSLLVLVAAGLRAADDELAGSRGEHGRPFFRWSAGLFVFLGALSTFRFAVLYADMAGEVYRRDVAAASWIRANLPRGVRMANVATSVEYLTGHTNLNLHGVTTPAFFGNRTAEREAGVFESLGRLPREERPGFLISSAAAQESFPSLQEIVEGPPIFRTASLSADDILILRMRYDLVGKNTRLFLPATRAATESLSEVDRLNVCDRKDEEAHEYTFTSGEAGVRLWGTARADDYILPGGERERVVDGGRAILGEESFVVRHAPGRDLVLVLRTAASVHAGSPRSSGPITLSLDFSEAVLSVDAGGRRIAGTAFSPRPGWDEVVVRLPGSALAGERTRLRVRGRYAAFFYWFFQQAQK